LFFYFLALVKNTKGVIFDRAITLFNNLSTIKAFPAFKVYEMIKKRLQHHQTRALWALHVHAPFLAVYKHICALTLIFSKINR